MKDSVARAIGGSLIAGAGMFALVLSTPAIDKLQDDANQPPPAAGERAQPSSSQPPSSQSLEGWPDTSRAVAERMIEKYGPPTESTPSMLIWQGNGPWKRTVVYREETLHQFPRRHSDVLEQTVNYRVPAKKLGDLEQFDGSLVVNRTKGELSAMSDSEEHNFLLLNLADEIANGKRSVKDARNFAAKTTVLTSAGRTSPYVDKLNFIVPTGDTADPDESIPEQKTLQEMMK